TTRTFLAIDVPSPLSERLTKLQARLAPLVPEFRWTDGAPFHMTLAFLGDVPYIDLNAVCEAAAKAAPGRRSNGPGLMGMGGMMAGMGGRPRDQAPAMEAKETVRQVGAKTFYLKEGRWVDSAVKPEDEAAAKVVRQFSDDYFNLARAQSSDWNQYLTFTEPVIVKLADAVYRIDPAEATR
ncbi:hypothetical protein HK102_013013, partial [Quaeritorhiza haematococci]